MPQTIARSPLDPRHAASDAMAGAVTFLVALPLCLGIAMASGTQAHPVAPFAGLIAGIVGGVVVGWLSGAQVMITGPAAGLTAVVAAELGMLGSFEALLLAVMVGGLVQIGLGLLQGGFIKSFVPTSVVRGMLSAIGVILILKQIPHLFGHDTDFEGEMSFFQPDRETTFSELFKILNGIHPGAMLVGLASLAMIWVWTHWRPTKTSGVPAPLMVVAFGLLADWLFAQVGGMWAIQEIHRVRVPVAESFAGTLAFLKSPDFSQFANPAVYTAGLTIALVGSLQALLTTEAVDRLDRERRTTPANRELVAQGFGNIVCGLLGGIPITGEIVRSTVNIDAGGVTKRAAIVHGGLLAAAILLFPRVINMIPLSCLAAILIATGLRLASPTVVSEIWRAGRYQFIPYLVTLVAIVFTDPLVGIIIGLVVSVGFILWSNLRRPMKLFEEYHLSGDVTRIELANQVSFLNRAALRKTLDAVPSGHHVLIDARDTVYIDPDILTILREYRDQIGPARGVQISTRGFRDKYDIGDDIQFVDHSSRELQATLEPARALQYLRDGNERFRTGRQMKRDLGRQVLATAGGQHPVAVVLHCIDSRSPAELLFDVGVGEIFSARVAGNIATDEVLGSMEYACAVAGAKLIVVLGHTRCGAVGAAVAVACHPDVPVAPDCTHLASIVESIGRVVDADACRRAEAISPERMAEAVDEAASRNVSQTVRDIRARSGVLDRMVREGKIGVVGMLYDVSTGGVWMVEGTAGGLPEAALATKPRAPAPA
jgi:carbonic anhydrase